MKISQIGKMNWLWLLLSFYGLLMLAACQQLLATSSPLHLEKTIDEQLLSAVVQSDVKKVSSLLSSGKVVDINVVNGQSLLKIAMDRFEFQIVKALLDNGADVNIKVLHGDKQVSILEYLFLKSEKDSAGYNAILVGFLLNHGVDLGAANLSQDLFMQILEKRVILLAQEGDLLFTTWLTLLQTVFQKQCFRGDQYSSSSLEICTNYVHRIHLFVEQLKRDQTIALNVGNMDLFMEDFDLCPANKDLLFPNIKGC